MAYIGTSPSNGVRRRFVYEATASQTSFSGSDENGVTLTYVDSLYLDVFQNGIKLKAGDDYTATTGTSVVLVQGASANDVVEMVAFDVFSVGDTVSAKDGGSFAGNVTMAGTLGVTGETTLTTHLNMGDGDIIKLGASADLQIQHDGSHSYVKDAGTGNLFLDSVAGSAIIRVNDGYNALEAIGGGAVNISHNGNTKIATASTGVNVTGGIGLGGTGTANILDDYEEGTWTPSFVVSPQGTVSALAGQYTKIGRLVYIQVQVTGSSLGISSYARIGGLPFTANNDSDTGTYILGSIVTRGHGWTTIAGGSDQWYFSTAGTVSSNTQMSASAVYRTDV